MAMRIVPVLACAALLGGCATLGMGGREPGAELIGRSAALITGNGQRSTLTFGQGGRVTAAFARGQSNGRWWVRERQLCFEWAGQAATRECWPYARPFRTGQTRTVTSTRGNVVRVTLL
jgi:hypothetical protein